MSAHRLAILGFGTMGRAVAGGLRDAEPGRWDIVGTVRHADTAARQAVESGLEVGVDNAAACAEADVVLLAVKPQAVAEVLGDPALALVLADRLVISICAGVTLKQLQALVPAARFVRAMPNTPAVIREGMTVISPSERATAADVTIASHIFSQLGRCRVLDEKHLDAVTGLSGSGPAFACLILESLADGGVMMGLPRDVAIELAAQTVQGAARLVLTTGEHPAALRDSVTTPAGCTIAGLFVMEDGKVRSTIARTVQEAARVAAALGRSCD